MGTTIGEFGELLASERLAEELPAVAGVNATVKAEDVPGARERGSAKPE
jgi:hypothetical protein